MRTCDACGREYSTSGSYDMGIPPCTHCGWSPTGPDAGTENDGVHIDEHGNIYQVVDTNVSIGGVLDELCDDLSLRVSREDDNVYNEFGVCFGDLDEEDY